jgi:hydrocephalus-inducing protein
MEKVFPNQHLCLRYDVVKRDGPAFLEDENTFHFSPTILNQTKRIQIALLNAVPIPCTVDITVKPVGKLKPKDHSGSPFSVPSNVVEIAASSRHLVDLTFAPTVLREFTAVFEAVVRGGTDPKSRLLKFRVEGVGTLPLVTVLDQTGKKRKPAPITFGRTLVNYKKDRTVFITNEGVIPARVCITADPSREFAFEKYEYVHEIDIEPQKIFPLVVVYVPKEVSKSVFHVSLDVASNPSASTALMFSGEGFLDDIVFEGIPGDDNELFFNNTIVGRQQQLTFTITNICEDIIRFQWQPMPDFEFIPRTGHLRPGQSKPMIAGFTANQPLRLAGIKTLCQWTRIRLTDPEAPDWDESMKTMKFITRQQLAEMQEEEFSPTPPDSKSPRASGRKLPAKPPSTPRPSFGMRSGQSPAIRKPVPLPPVKPVVMAPHPSNRDLVKIAEVKPEPEYEVIPGKMKEVIVRCNTIADFIHYSLSTTEVAFSPTMMYETRVVEVKMSNTSQIRFNYRWFTIKLMSIQMGDSKFQACPFVIEPQSGSIEPGTTTILRVIFSPMDVDDYNAHFSCEIPFLGDEPPPDIFVSGISRRPLCHFNIATSDYLSAGRRHPDYVYPVPDDVRVIELFSSGIGHRSIKKFEIINATSQPYEIFWTRDLQHSNSVITCGYPRMLISSGKRAGAMFAFLPVSVKTVESIWIFTIPEHEVTITFMVVGRIMPT